MTLWNLQALNKLRTYFIDWIPAFTGMTAAIFLVLLVNVQTVNAANEFSTTYDIEYSVNQDGTTDVTQNIKLKNLTDKFFPSSFSVTLPGTEVDQIEARDNKGPLATETALDGSNTKVTVRFTNQQIIGLNKEYPWTLSFKDKSIARNLAKVWNINLPKISQQTQVENLKLTLSVPSSFGDPDFISPKPSAITESGGRINLIFTQNELLNSGISAIFGDSLTFEFDLSYILKNNAIFPKYFNVAIPSDMSYQRAYIKSIEPHPENVVTDELGNVFAIFKVNSNQEYEVKVKGNAKTFLNSQQKDVIGEAQRSFYLKDSQFWDTSNPNIKTKLSEILMDQNPNDFEKARIVNKYVSNFLRFESQRIEKNDFTRFGSITALNNPEKSLSAEFVDLETALLRASNIPTRQIIGFALPSENKPFSFANQNLHTWLEFYDNNLGWVITDPTWENTTSGADFFAFNDLNHIALVISGGDDKFVLPGSVETRIYEGQLNEEKAAELDVQIDEEILSGFPSKGKIRINNLGQIAFPASTLQIDTAKILLEFPGEQPIITKSINTPKIPPFGHLEYEFNLKTGAIWHSYQDAFQVRFSGVDDTRLITVTPILSYKIYAVEIIGGIIMIILFYVLILLLHHKSIKKD